ncbi:YhcB family protein [uncultured Actinobacillus sp.]|uniref:YhcB family protein n=1 Tax=uncultured Actinobacillus sp. TaxID=417616 RepID=UPI0025F08FAD|nr:YhcB family protein [uncultured Actinobacillus sp.]
MENLTPEMWKMIALGFVAGVILTYLALRLTKGSVRKQAKTENELQQTKAELAQQTERLEKHFAETADLFKLLAQDYQKLYRHLAKSSDELLPESQKTLFLQSFINSDKSTASPEVNSNEQPRDYKEGSSGLFKAER